MIQFPLWMEKKVGLLVQKKKERYIQPPLVLSDLMDHLLDMMEAGDWEAAMGLLYQTVRVILEESGCKMHPHWEIT